MDWKIFFAVVLTAFVAELGDKSQVLTLLYASTKQAPLWVVFLGVSFALVLATGIGVLAGGLLTNFLSEKTLGLVSGVGFIVLGAFTLYRVAAM